MSNGNSPTSKEKERISKSAHAACCQVLGLLIGHESLKNNSLKKNAKDAIYEGKYTGVDELPNDLKTKLSRKSMGLDIVQKLLGSKPSRCRFKTCERFSKDVRFVFQNILLWQNYYKENKPDLFDSILYQTAKRLLQGFEMMYTGELAQYVTSSVAPSSSPEPPPAISPPPSIPPPVVVKNDIAGRLQENDIQKCQGIVQRIIKHKELGVSLAAPFFNPVDLTMYVDYKVKIPQRMHLFGVQQKLSNGAYRSLAEFAKDMRLIFSNCLVYNSDVILSAKIREHAVKLMHIFEQVMQQTFPGTTWTGLPETDRWKCHQVIQDILVHRSSNGIETAQWFKHPIVTYFASPDQAPYNYFKIIKRPMDIGTVTSRLHLGEYTDVAGFAGDLRLVFDNCLKYWKGNADGQVYRDAAKTMISTMQSSLATAFGSTFAKNLIEGSSRKSEKVLNEVSGSSDVSVVTQSVVKTDKPKKSSKSDSSSQKSRREFAEKENCLRILELIRQHKMRGVMGEIYTAGPFLHAVDITKYPDYAQIVTEPMDFNKIERKLKSNRYSSVSEFSADVHLIFSNCMKYNSDPIEGADIRTMASNLRDYFVLLYKDLEDGNDIVAKTIPFESQSKVKKPISIQTTNKEIKNISKEENEIEKKKKEKKEKKKKKKEKKEKKKHKKDEIQTNSSTIPFESIPVPIGNDTKSSSPSKPIKKTSSASAKLPAKQQKVKLDLSTWEATCERVVSRILKLDFVAAMHFDAPLIEKFPDLTKIYRSIITEPMDLGTLRQRLIAHSIPDCCEFVRLGRLIFENAKIFNSGPDAASIRVRETADHLRWLFDSLCVEMSVLNEPDLRRQWRNDRFTAVQTLKFTENKPNKECLKVHKSITSQKHVKDVWPFVEPAQTLFKDLPSTYFEIVKNPMDLKTISEKLNSLAYKSYGDFISDIRLTFDNAMLYNQLDKGKEGWTVYSAAKKLSELATDLWGEVTIDVVERLRRGVLLHKEAQVELEKNRVAAEARAVVEEAERIKEYHIKLEQQKKDEAEIERRLVEEKLMEKKETRIGQNDLNKTKSERKNEEKRKKKQKKEEELKQKEKRNRTAAQATENALHEAEERSRNRMKRYEMIRIRDEREKQTKLEFQKIRRKPIEKRKQTIETTSNQPFWKIKRRKLNLAPIFNSTIPCC